MSDTQTLDRARRSLDDHAWQDAYDAFVSLRDREDLSPEDWERLGEAAWWSAHPEESLEAFERVAGSLPHVGRDRPVDEKSARREKAGHDRVFAPDAAGAVSGDESLMEV